MSERRLLHLGVTWSEAPHDEIVALALEKAPDWLHYAPGCWLIVTKKTAKEWAERLRSHLSPADQFLIMRVDPKDRAGMLPREAWDWIRKSQPPGIFSVPIEVDEQGRLAVKETKSR